MGAPIAYKTTNIPGRGLFTGNNNSDTVTIWLMNNGQYTGSAYGYSIGADWQIQGMK